MNNTPQFCTVCGKRLQETSKVQSYDPYTGTPLEQREAVCIQPVLILGKFGRATESKDLHNSWINDDGNWVRQV